MKDGTTTSYTVITFQMPSVNYVRITEISLFPDSSFSSYGKFNIMVAGNTQCDTPKGLKSGYTIDTSKFKSIVKLPDGREVEGLVLAPNEKIEIPIWSDGTNQITLSVGIVGELL
jgi:hypothetical protein